MPTNVVPQATPNPNAMKFTLDVSVASGGSKTFDTAQKASEDPLASKIFEIRGVQQVFFLNNFITVTKDGDAIWADLGPEVVTILSKHFE